jgi:UDP-glucose 4-epimerase
MRAFVADGASYIGSICVEELLNPGHQVTVYDNLSEGHRLAVDPRAKLIQNCLSDATGVKHASQEQQPEALMHFAANALVGGSMIRENTSGTTSPTA